jgi:hypothetical protein
MSPSLESDLSFDIIWELTKKKAFFDIHQKNCLQQPTSKCATSFLSLSCLNSLNLWHLGTFESCHSLQALPTKILHVVSPCLFFLYILFDLCVLFMNMGCSSLETYEYLYWVNFKPKSNTNKYLLPYGEHQ